MIPLEILKIKDNLRDGYHLFCRVHIKNKEFRMLVDTGASMTMFDIDISSKISDNILEDNYQEVVAVGNGDVESKIILIEEMRIGDIILKDYKTILINLNHINNYFKKNGNPLIDGVIGGDILNNYNSVIDYKNREMKLS